MMTKPDEQRETGFDDARIIVDHEQVERTLGRDVGRSDRGNRTGALPLPHRQKQAETTASTGDRADIDPSAKQANDALGERHGWSAEESALGIYEIAVANMVNAIREITVQKGHDPREFTLFAYGGMTPAFAWAVASRAGVENVVVPPQSAAFSAWGVIQADHVRRYDEIYGTWPKNERRPE